MWLQNYFTYIPGLQNHNLHESGQMYVRQVAFDKTLVCLCYVLYLPNTWYPVAHSERIFFFFFFFPVLLPFFGLLLENLEVPRLGA